MQLTSRCIFLGIVALSSMVIVTPLGAQLTLSEQETLAQRFRPYMKMSMGNGSGDEPYHPANWQWIVGNSTFRHNSSTLVEAQHWSSSFDELLTNGGNLSTNPQDPELHLDVMPSAHGGEPWSDVIHKGHGLYAHVEQVSTSLINIEYTITWPYNEPPGVPSQSHDGDVTTMVVLYDQIADLISRVSYSAHGCILQVYQPRSGQNASIDDLLGENESFNPIETAVARIDIGDENAAHVVSNPCHGVTTSESHIFLAEDPDTHIYQHPVVFVEIGGHEFWPNGSGFLAAAGGHDGKGVSFLPECVQLLGTFANPQRDHVPFLFYNGLFGTDPHAIALHSTWCWPPSCGKNIFGIDDGRFTDLNPYHSAPAGFGASPSNLYVTYPNWQSVGTGTQNNPIPGFALAYSVTPARSVLHLPSGHYGGRITLRRAMTIVADDGPIVLGGTLR